MDRGGVTARQSGFKGTFVSGKKVEPEQGKRHGTDERWQHAQNGKLHDSTGAQSRCQHDESAAAGKIVQQKGRGELADESGRKQYGRLHEELRYAENTDDGTGIGGNEQSRGKIQQSFNDKERRISREAFLHGSEESQPAAGKHHEKNGKLFPHVLKRSILFLSDFTEGGGYFVGCQHDKIFKTEHFAYESTEKKRTYNRRQSLRFADHEDAHADIDAAEDKKKVFSECFAEKSSDVASDKGAEKNAG